MEITDVLNSNNTSYNAGSKAISQKKENKFQQLLEKNFESNNTVSHVKKEKPIDTKLMNVCIEMESIFVGKMLKEMRNSLPKEKLIDGGFAEKIFEDMLYDEYALNLSKTSNLGIAKMLYNDLSRK
ncbi:MAG: rod-binding protein [Spirochaetota bacterium]